MFPMTRRVHRLVTAAGLTLVVMLPPEFAGASRLVEQQAAPRSSTDQPRRGGSLRPGRPTDELAFVRDGHLYFLRLDGSDPVQLTSDAVDSEPAWSPDGQRIAFVRSWDIYLMNADGSNIVRRTNAGSNASPAWSPDGRQIAFASVRDGHLGVYAMRVDEDWWNVAHLGFDRGYNTHPAWSPDGSSILFVSDWRAYDFLYDLYVVRPEGAYDAKLLLGGPLTGGLTYYFQPAFSPDGGTVALTVCPWAADNCYPDSAVALVNADGSGLRTIAGAGGFARPSWSPDGLRIAFGATACRGCPSTIYSVTRDGLSTTLLVSNAHSPSWRPQRSPAARSLR